MPEHCGSVTDFVTDGNKYPAWIVEFGIQGRRVVQRIWTIDGRRRLRLWNWRARFASQKKAHHDSDGGDVSGDSDGPDSRWLRKREGANDNDLRSGQRHADDRNA